MNKQLRQDLICERVRNVCEIRKRLADSIKKIKYIHFSRREEDIATAKRLNIEIQILKWILNHDESLRVFYKEKYGRTL